MNPAHKKTLRALALELRHILEGKYDAGGAFHPGDLETRLNALGVWRERPARPLDELPHLAAEDKAARRVVDAYIAYRRTAGVGLAEAVAEYVRESAYNWANRLLALRCMEARGLIDEVILQKEVYGWRSLAHQRLARRSPAACSGPDEGLFAVLLAELAERSRELPELFDPQAAAIALRPSLAALQCSIALLSGRERAGSAEPASDEVFSAPDALGWAYQYWNSEEKERVFEKVRTQKGAKIAGADIIPATQLYTEPYMVKFLVQNSLGALWLSMHPESGLAEKMEYYVKDADRAPAEARPVQSITLLDPAAGSGHFLLEAFDLFFEMYRDLTPNPSPEAKNASGEGRETRAQIAASILNHNLYAVDIDGRAIQITAAALWMKAKEAAPDLPASELTTFHQHLVATNIRLPQGKDHLAAFLRQHPDAAALRPALETIFEGLQNVHELGSLVQIEEPVERELQRLKSEADAARGQAYQPGLLPGFTPPRQGELPLGVEDYAAWKAKTLRALQQHFAAEARAADPLQALFGQSAQRGMALFEVLARKYEVVVANPPYMGSKNMGAVTKSYTERHYQPGKRDLYAAFILRCYELALPAGRVAMVTQQSWMFLRSFAELRAAAEADLEKLAAGDFKGLLRDAAIETLAHLGEHAFEETAAAGAFVVLFTLTKTTPSASHRLTAFRLVGPKSPEEKQQLLQNAVSRSKDDIVFNVAQFQLLIIPQSPLCYWLRKRFFELLLGLTVANVADVCQGTATSDDGRYVRFHWEILPSNWISEKDVKEQRWVPFEKGGGYGKWFGHHFWVVEWDHNGIRLKSHRGAYVRNENQYFKSGWTYSYMARGSLGVRLLEPRCVFAHISSAVLPFQNDLNLSAPLNSRISSFLVRALSARIQITESYILRLPIPTKNSKQLSDFTDTCVILKKHLVEQDVTERSFDSTHFGVSDQYSVTSVILHTLEGIAEQIVISDFDLDEQDIALVFDETGMPAGCFPILTDYDALPILPIFLQAISTILHIYAQTRQRYTLSAAELDALRRRLRSLYEAGPGVRSDEEDDGADDEESADDSGAHIPIPAETFLEELSQKLQIHPISVYWLLKEGIEQEGWRCPPEEKRLAEDRLTVLILRLLGHRWPKQIEAGEALPAWADPDGIIPLVEGLGDAPLLERVQDLPPPPPSLKGKAGQGWEDGFAGMVGESLGAWLAGSFFRRHLSQFKKRPIAWQVVSTPAAGRKKGLRREPVVSLLLYYHKLDTGLLARLRAQYAAPLRQRHETELRTLESRALISPEQSARRLQLGEWIAELQAFEARVQQVEQSGFATPALRQQALEEALRCITAQWLAEVEARLRAAALPAWQEHAAAAHLHADLPAWLDEAFHDLSRLCTQVNPPGLPAERLAADPAAADFAAWLAPHEPALRAAALRLACARWQDRLDEAALKPLKEQIKTAGTNKASLRGQLKELEKRAERLSAEIQAWAGDLPGEAWLAARPLYDQLSALDATRRPPQSLAEFVIQEGLYAPDLNDGVRVNIAPLQKAGLLAAEVLDAKDIEKAIADRAEWRGDERKWCREGKLPKPGWWK